MGTQAVYVELPVSGMTVLTVKIRFSKKAEKYPRLWLALSSDASVLG